MSADTTMAILKTRRLLCPPGQCEYRVALVQAVENAWPDLEAEEPLRSLLFQKWWLKVAFGQSRVYRDARTARKVARRKACRFRRRGGILEYGCRTVNLSPEVFPLVSQEQLESLMREHKVWPFHRQ